MGCEQLSSHVTLTRNAISEVGCLTTRSKKKKRAEAKAEVRSFKKLKKREREIIGRLLFDSLLSFS